MTVRASHQSIGSSIHGALVLANFIFGLGSIVGAVGLPATNPLSFTFVREICAGSLLLLLSALSVGEEGLLLPRKRHLLDFFKLGFLLFLNQAGYIVGIGLAGPVTGSVWQPSAPIFTVAISMLWRLEQWNGRRLTGVLVAFGGCVAMVVLNSDDRAADATHGGTTAFWIGNAMFLLNCSATAFYILLSKPVLRHYPSLTVTAWSYNLASVFMLGAAFLSDSLPSILSLICPACSPPQDSFVIDIPRDAWPALTYYIVFQSVISWGLILWANQHATGTLVVGYSVLQPVSSILFTTLFLITHWVASCHQEGAPTPCLNEPSLGTLCGMAGVACGLCLVIQTEPTPAERGYDEDQTQHITASYGSVS